MVFAFFKGAADVLAIFTSVGLYCLYDKGGREGWHLVPSPILKRMRLGFFY